jgi:polyisoprenoid-binding protein YceI
MKKSVILLCLCFNFALGFAQHTSGINFIIRNLGVGVDGHFESFTIQPYFENDTLKTLSGSIPVATLKTGIDLRDEHLLKADYFHATKYPEIKFKSTKITPEAQDSYTVIVALTIKGKTKTITIPVRTEKIETGYKLEATFEINRADFDVGGGGLVLSKTVKTDVVYYHKL